MRFASSSNILRSVCAVVLAASLFTAAPGCARWRAGAKASRTTAITSADNSAEDSFQTGADRPPSPKTLYALARIFQTQGQDPQAETVLRRIIVDEPKYMPAYCDLAEVQMRQRRVEEAYRTLSEGLKFGPNEPILLNDRGMCQLLLHEYDGALTDFISATALRPDDARYRSNMAVALAMLGRYDESLALYTLAMPAPDAHHNLAVLCEARGDSKSAAEYREGKRPRAAIKVEPPVVTTVAAESPVVDPADVAGTTSDVCDNPKAPCSNDDAMPAS
jgi:Flp pilus assembly protein TadD